MDIYSTHSKRRVAGVLAMLLIVVLLAMPVTSPRSGDPHAPTDPRCG